MSELREILTELNDYHVNVIYSVLKDNANVPDISLEEHEEPTKKLDQIEAILKMDGINDSIDAFRDKFDASLSGGNKTEMFTTDAKEIHNFKKEDFEKFQTFLDKVIEGDPKAAGDPKKQSLFGLLSLFNVHNLPAENNVSAENIQALSKSVGVLIDIDNNASRVHKGQ